MAIGLINLSDLGKINTSDLTLLVQKIKSEFKSEILVEYNSFTSDKCALRLKCLQNLQNNNVDWILSSNGGKISLEFLKYLHKKKFLLTKSIVGNSDIDHLNVYYNQKYGVQTLYGPTLKSFKHEVNTQSLKNAIYNSQYSLSIMGTAPNISGKIIVSHIEILSRLFKNKLVPKLKSPILLTEYHGYTKNYFEKQLLYLKSHGFLDNVTLIILGKTDEEHNTSNISNKICIPIAKTEEFGDFSKTLSFKNGANVIVKDNNLIFN